MTVKKRIEKSVENFIDNGAEVKVIKKKKIKIKRVGVLVSIPIDVLSALDEIVERKSEVSRTAWIVQALREKITKDS